MIKRNQVYLNRLNALSDFLLVFFSYIFSAWFRLRVLHGWYENRGLSRPMILASLFYAAGLLVVLSIFGFYSSNRIKRLSWKIGTLFISITITTAAGTSPACFTAKWGIRRPLWRTAYPPFSSLPVSPRTPIRRPIHPKPSTMAFLPAVWNSYQDF